MKIFSYEDIDRKILAQKKADLIWLDKIRSRILSEYSALSSQPYNDKKHSLCLQLADVELQIERLEKEVRS